ncbi:MAG TPA: S-layer homology domain-containing protein [Clostridiales bacterium]|nr:S-layer homology domain-containing protein [Clostridiales bacterium]
MLGFKRKIFYLLLISIISTLVFNVPSVAVEQDKPSDWAVEEVTEAIEKNLVPKLLQANYRGSIKRYEYVLLALEVYDITGKEVAIVDKKPFTDAINHKFEQEMVRAYNAGIVKGDGKGSFKPDDYITRQEIASLVVNLLKQILPDKDFTVKNNYKYNDGDQISDWAKYYIDYCFENKILTGYGNNIIDPKGNATIEQSIALLIRLAKNEGLFDTTPVVEESIEYIQTDPIKFEEISTGTKNRFTEEYSADTLSILENLAKNEKVIITSFYDKSTSIALEYNSILLNSPDFEKNLFALVHDINEDLFVTTYKELLIEMFNDGDQGVLVFEQYIEKMKNKEIIEVYEEINETELFSIQTMKDKDNVSYSIAYVQKKY